jgi:peptidoglycan/LPS O-acetylase OafA/YrhL
VHYFVKDWVKFLAVGPSIPAWLPAIIYVVVIAGASALLYRTVEIPGRLAVRAALLGPGSRRIAASQAKTAS